MKKIFLIVIAILAIGIFTYIPLYSQWDPPCSFGDCTGTWYEGTMLVYIPGCVTCEITVHYHYRTAYCPNNDPTDEYQFHIDYIEGSPTCYMCWNVPNDVDFIKIVLNRFLIKLGIQLQNANVLKLV